MKYDVGIIGSGPAGLSAAIYAKRANLSAVVIEKEYEGTGQIAESGQVDNYPGFPGISGYDLGENFREHAVKLGVSFMEQEVTEIKKEASSDFELVFTDGSQMEAKTVIYAAGATPRRANIPGEQEYAGKESLTVRSVTDHFTEVNQLQFLVVEIQHLMMLFTWRMWQRKYM